MCMPDKQASQPLCSGTQLPEACPHTHHTNKTNQGKPTSAAQQKLVPVSVGDLLLRGVCVSRHMGAADRFWAIGSGGGRGGGRG